MLSPKTTLADCLKASWFVRVEAGSDPPRPLPFFHNPMADPVSQNFATADFENLRSSLIDAGYELTDADAQVLCTYARAILHRLLYPSQFIFPPLPRVPHNRSPKRSTSEIGSRSH